MARMLMIVLLVALFSLIAADDGEQVGQCSNGTDEDSQNKTSAVEMKKVENIYSLRQGETKKGKDILNQQNETGDKNYSSTQQDEKVSVHEKMEEVMLEDVMEDNTHEEYEGEEQELDKREVDDHEMDDYQKHEEHELDDEKDDEYLRQKRNILGYRYGDSHYRYGDSHRRYGDSHQRYGDSHQRYGDSHQRYGDSHRRYGSSHQG